MFMFMFCLRVFSLHANNLASDQSSDADYKVDFSGVIAFAEMLKSNSTLADVKYATPYLESYCQQPLMPPFDSRS